MARCTFSCFSVAARLVARPVNDERSRGRSRRTRLPATEAMARETRIRMKRGTTRRRGAKRKLIGSSQSMREYWENALFPKMHACSHSFSFEQTARPSACSSLERDDRWMRCSLRCARLLDASKVTLLDRKVLDGWAESEEAHCEKAASGHLLMWSEKC